MSPTQESHDDLPGTPSPEPTLGALLLSAARATSDAQAAAASALGTLGAAAIFLFAPGWWRIALIALAVACFGVWIVLERTQTTSAWRTAGKAIAVACGTTCLFVVALSLLTKALGTWIS